MLHYKKQSQLFKRQLFCHAIDSRRQCVLCMYVFVRLSAPSGAIYLQISTSLPVVAYIHIYIHIYIYKNLFSLLWLLYRAPGMETNSMGLPISLSSFTNNNGKYSFWPLSSYFL